jgi:hypothetical protein
VVKARTTEVSMVITRTVSKHKKTLSKLKLYLVGKKRLAGYDMISLYRCCARVSLKAVFVGKEEGRIVVEGSGFLQYKYGFM